MKKYIESLVHEFSFFGSLPFFAFAGLAFLAMNRLQNFYEIAAAGILLYASVSIIRSIYFKDRPKKVGYGNFMEKIDASAFPSLHSARAAFLAAYVYLKFSNTAIFALAALAAVLVFYSRMKMQKHYLSDVAGGVILGVLVALLVHQIM